MHGSRGDRFLDKLDSFIWFIYYYYIIINKPTLFIYYYYLTFPYLHAILDAEIGVLTPVNKNSIVCLIPDSECKQTKECTKSSCMTAPFQHIQMFFFFSIDQ